MKRYLHKVFLLRFCFPVLLLILIAPDTKAFRDSRFLTSSVVVSAEIEPDLSGLHPNARQVFLDSMSWGDRYWDSQEKLLRAESGTTAFGHPLRFLVRESSWYALGLLLRNRQGDRERAIEILNAVLEQQYDEPGKPWDGTFRRSPQEPEPPANAVMWRDYDPNWREFIGCTFAIILEEYSDRLPGEMIHRLNASIAHAIDGEIKNHRLVPAYTNPALMYGFLWNYAAVHDHRDDWLQPSIAWQEQVYRLFARYHSFPEYNSPTYCGVDLYALGLWRKYGFSEHMRAMGSEMETALWRDLADFYNANLRNISGPFDRAYGMDMESYISVVGVALRTVLGENQAPLPKLASLVDHVGDLWFAPQFAIVGVRIPSDAMQKFQSFHGAHQVRHRIDEKRVATAWIGKNVIYGGEITAKTRDIGEHSQFHPATVQWQTPRGKIGWVQLTKSPPLDAVADRTGLQISCSGDVSFRIYMPGGNKDMVKQKIWKLPGLTVRLSTDAKKVTIEPGNDFVDVEYLDLSKISLVMQSLK